MANKKAAKKSIRSDARKKLVNYSRKSRIRTYIRKVEDQIKLGNKEEALKAFKSLEPELMRGVTKKIFKLNTVARKLSRIFTSIKRITTQPKKEKIEKKTKTAKKA
ncbi:30S ribosomal protein S20 [Rickettsiales bacterium]|jgi:small subunit ribosomal protein S20|nr:30S ribosomal protein S20 [Rickettsiales bacterium]|tara:strand:+ start:2883 stop:3200 length:318 start_codon:yes stop_codon:yes gene_type:complete